MAEMILIAKQTIKISEGKNEIWLQTIAIYDKMLHFVGGKERQSRAKHMLNTFLTGCTNNEQTKEIYIYKCWGWKWSDIRANS